MAGKTNPVLKDEIMGLNSILLDGQSSTGRPNRPGL
jgi:hypothetical protein